MRMRVVMWLSFKVLLSNVLVSASRVLAWPLNPIITHSPDLLPHHLTSTSGQFTRCRSIYNCSFYTKTKECPPRGTGIPLDRKQDCSGCPPDETALQLLFFLTSDQQKSTFGGILCQIYDQFIFNTEIEIGGKSGPTRLALSNNFHKTYPRFANNQKVF